MCINIILRWKLSKYQFLLIRFIILDENLIIFSAWYNLNRQIKLQTRQIRGKYGQYVKGRSIRESDNQDSEKNEFRFWTILDTILKMFSFVKTQQQVTPIGLQRRCSERYFNQQSFTVIQCYRLLYTTSAYNITLNWKSLKVEHN